MSCSERAAPVAGDSGDPNDRQRRDERDRDRYTGEDVTDIAPRHREGGGQADRGRGDEFHDRRRHAPGHLGVLRKRLDLRQCSSQARRKYNDEQRCAQHQGRGSQQRTHLPLRDGRRHALDGRRERGDDHRSDHSGGGITLDTRRGHNRGEHQQQPEPALLGADVADEEIHGLADLLGRPCLVGQVCGELARHTGCLLARAGARPRRARPRYGPFCLDRQLLTVGTSGKSVGTTPATVAVSVRPSVPAAPARTSPALFRERLRVHGFGSSEDAPVLLVAVR